MTSGLASADVAIRHEQNDFWDMLPQYGIDELGVVVQSLLTHSKVIVDANKQCKYLHILYLIRIDYYSVW